MMGQKLPYRRSVPVRLTEPIKVKPRLQHFLRGVVGEAGGELVARLTGPQGSGILTSMIQANALLIVPEGQFETPAGETLRALMLNDPVHQGEPAF
jgi:molybdopterin molybdotransferase